MLELFLHGVLSARQHGFQPGKGTFTAWKDLVGKIDRYKYVYEIDLKGCFPNISATRVTACLEKLGVPPAVFYWLENINRCDPELPRELLLDESVALDKMDVNKSLKDGVAPSPGNSLMAEVESLDKETLDLVVQMAKEDGAESLEEFVQMQWALLSSFAPPESQMHSVGNSHRGLAQGAPTSPLLTILALDDFVRQQQDAVFYADDGLFMSDVPFEIKDDPTSGIVVHPEKSR